jgi:sulfatase maturation enzyme AslB (radical SAM superfamily)
MHCPRLRHFTRLNHDGTFGRCGHMTNARGFQTHQRLEDSEWLKEMERLMSKGQWPEECIRCQRTEQVGGKSVRLASIDRDTLLRPLAEDYLVVGGVLDNVCNSACQTCNATLSTKIASLESRDYVRTNNYEKFWEIPQDRIVELDVSGGEPTASKNYKKLLGRLPETVRIVRMNTNGSKMIPELELLLKNKIKVIVTLSLDGIGKIHDYVRWPISWYDYEKTVDRYLDLQSRYKLLEIDTWTTVSCLNINDLSNIIDYTGRKGLKHNWAFLEQPKSLNVKYSNVFTRMAKHLYPDQICVDDDNSHELGYFIRAQDRLRQIDHRDYFNFPLNFSKKS